MNKKGLSILMYVLSAISLAIAVYQFTGGRLGGGALSVVFALAFLVGAIGNQRAGRHIADRAGRPPVR
jgi:hypothetical protein